MKIAITAQNPSLESPVDARFGRAAHFVVVDPATGEFSTVSNTQNLQAAQGAGIQAGRAVVALGVSALITGHVGPKAFATLQAGGIDVYTTTAETVAQAIEQFQAGKLTPAANADVEGHW